MGISLSLSLSIYLSIYIIIYIGEPNKLAHHLDVQIVAVEDGKPAQRVRLCIHICNKLHC